MKSRTVQGCLPRRGQQNLLAYCSSHAEWPTRLTCAPIHDLVKGQRRRDARALPRLSRLDGASRLGILAHAGFRLDGFTAVRSCVILGDELRPAIVEWEETHSCL